MSQASEIPTTTACAERFPVRDPAMTAARERAAELGCTPVSPATGATLRLLAGLSAARAVVEVGTGAGVSGLALLAGMAPQGILTTVDLEGEHQKAARAAFADAAIANGRFRMINGSAAEVLPRLADGAYDLVFIDAEPGDATAYPQFVEQALRLLRPGGVLAVHDPVPGASGEAGRAEDPDGTTDDDTAELALPPLLAAVRSDERLLAALLPVGQGLLAAVKL